MKTSKRVCFATVSLLGVVLIISYLVWNVRRPSHDLMQVVQVKKEVHKNYGLDAKKQLSNQLVLLAKEIRKAKRYARSQVTAKYLMNADTKLLEILDSIDCNETIDESAFGDNETEAKTQLVCPEVYKGTKFGYPYYQTGWDIVPCNAPPFNAILTILMNMKGESEVLVRKILKGIEKSYPSLSVHVALDSEVGDLNGFDLTVKTFVMKEEAHGAAWNKLLHSVKTPYLLIGRELVDFDKEARLERQVRIANELGLDVVGGATRKEDGQWSIGCRQFVMLNYTLAYIEGYDISRNSCLYCEHLTGPFVARTNAMKQHSFYSFDESLISKELLFEDLFIRMKQNDRFSMVCPDAMYFVKDTEQMKNNKNGWLSLVRKFGLNRIKLHDGKTLSYSCEEANTHCRVNEYKGIAVPICCLEEAARGMNAIFKLCDKKGYVCETDGGSLIGSLKMNGILPWDIDGDMAYSSKNHSGFLNNMKYFEDQGMKLIEGYGIEDKSGFMEVKVSGWILEMWGMRKLLTEDDILSGRNVTKIISHGYEHSSMVNPGKVARNRYGYEIYRHAIHWRALGEQSSWITYKPGTYKSCPIPGHHACLDQYLGDGNIQFKGPWI